MTMMTSYASLRRLGQQHSHITRQTLKHQPSCFSFNMSHFHHFHHHLLRTTNHHQRHVVVYHRLLTNTGSSSSSKHTLYHNNIQKQHFSTLVASKQQFQQFQQQQQQQQENFENNEKNDGEKIVLCASAKREMNSLIVPLHSILSFFSLDNNNTHNNSNNSNKNENENNEKSKISQKMKETIHEMIQLIQSCSDQSYARVIVLAHKALLLSSLLNDHTVHSDSCDHHVERSMRMTSYLYHWSSRFLLVFSNAQKTRLLSELVSLSHSSSLSALLMNNGVMNQQEEQSIFQLISHVRIMIALKRGDDMLLRVLDSLIHQCLMLVDTRVDHIESSSSSDDVGGDPIVLRMMQQEGLVVCLEDQTRMAKSTAALLHLLKALACNDAGMGEETVEETTKSIELLNDFSVAYVIRGLTLLSMEETEQGLRDLNHAVQLDVKEEENDDKWLNNPLSLMQRAMATVRMNPHDAFHDIERALEMEPDNPTIYLIRGHMNAEMDSSVDDALQDYSTSVELNQGVPAGYYSRANLLSKYDEHLSDALNDLDLIESMDQNYAAGYNLRAVILNKQGHYSKALECVDRVIEIDSHFPLIYELQGKIYLEGLSDRESATKSFEKAVELRSMTCESLVNLGNIYMTTGNHELALQYLNDAIEMEPYSGQTYFARAKFNFECKRNFREAIQDFEKGIEVANESHAPISEQVFIDKAACLLALKDHAKAIAELKHVLQLDISSMQKSLCLILIGESYAQSNRVSQAMECLDEAAEMAPNALVHFKRAMLLRNVLDRKEDALSNFTKAIDLSNGTRAEFYYERAVTFVALDNTPDALSDLNQAIALDGDYVEALGDRASIYFSQSKYREALEDADHVIRLEPDNVAAFYNLRGKIRSMNGEVHEAKEDFDLAIELGPNDPTVYLNRARLYLESLDNIRKGFMDLSHALSINEKYFDVYLYRSNYYRTVSKNFKKALEDGEACVLLDPSSPYAYYERGMSHLGMESYDSAMKDLNRCIELQSDDSRMFGARALLKLKLNQPEQSLVDCLRAMELNSVDVDALNLGSVILIQLDRMNEALDCIRASISLDQTQVVPRVIRACAHVIAGVELDLAKPDIEWLEGNGSIDRFNNLKMSIQEAQLEPHVALSNLFDQTF